MRPDVADVAEHKADEHEEKADQRERSGRADHLCKQADKKSTSDLCFFTLKLRVKLLACFFLVHWGLLSSAGHKSIVSVHASKMEMEVPAAQRELRPQGMCVLWRVTFYHVSECEA